MNFFNRNNNTNNDNGGDETQVKQGKIKSNPYVLTIPQFVEQMTIGIQYCVNDTENELEGDPSILFSNKTHQIDNQKMNSSFEVIEYSKKAFSILREFVFNIKKEIFIEEWKLPEEQLNAKEGAGRSGSLFCYSRTKRFIGKTILKAEVQALTQLLPVYFEYMQTTSKESLIMRLLGLFHYPSSQNGFTNDVYLLVFENVLWAKNNDYYANPLGGDIDNNNINGDLLPIHNIFDLKGRLNKTRRYHSIEGYFLIFLIFLERILV